MFFILATTLIHFANAGGLQPPVGAKICMGRQYTNAELSAHPQQKLSNMAVIIENFKSTDPDGIDYVTAKVLGTHDGKLWGNEAGCEYNKDGSLSCQIECDGGAFTLNPIGEKSADFNVKKDYYFPLYLGGSDGENPGPDNMLSLDFKDSENRSFRLFPAATANCETLWKRYLTADHGC